MLIIRFLGPRPERRLAPATSGKDAKHRPSLHLPFPYFRLFSCSRNPIRHLSCTAMLQRLVVLLAILPTVLIQRCIAATCYGYDGSAATNNQVCPGSNACCGASATCLSNRLCHNVGDGNGTFVRGPCAVKPYDPQTCAEICLYGSASPSLFRITNISLTFPQTK